ncbi:MAG: AbrB/MazE/SpoVT family DNA-binding domain-containing protein [Candidatus Baldrarchaeia archaeon]
MNVYRAKVGKGGVMYLPSEVRKILGVEKGGEVLLVVSEGRVELRPVKSIFVLGAESPKISKITIEEFERESEEMQREFYG